jgi:hypothetical protein
VREARAFMQMWGLLRDIRDGWEISVVWGRPVLFILRGLDGFFENLNSALTNQSMLSNVPNSSVLSLLRHNE